MADKTPAEQIKAFKEKYGVRLKKTIKYVTKKTGDKALEDLKRRTKEGTGTEGKLKQLSGDYIAFRRRWEAFLAKDTSPAKSNLTATGQMLDALYLRVVADKFFIKVNTKNRDEALGGENLVEVKKDTFKTVKKKNFFGKVKKTKTKTGTKTVGFQSKLTNDDVRKYTEEAGREFLKLSDEETRQLKEFALSEFKIALSDILNNGES